MRAFSLNMVASLSAYALFTFSASALALALVAALLAVDETVLLDEELTDDLVSNVRSALFSFF